MVLGGAAAYAVSRFFAERQARRDAELAPHPFVLRRESLLDISDPEDPRQETVLVAEGLDISDLEIDEEIIDEFEPDPSEGNSTATIAGHDERFAISDEEMAVHEAAVIAEAERIEHEHATSEGHVKSIDEVEAEEVAAAATTETPDDESSEEEKADETELPTETETPPTPEALDDNASDATSKRKRKGKRSRQRESSSSAPKSGAERRAKSPSPAEGDRESNEQDEQSTEVEPEKSDAITWIQPIAGECPLDHPIKARYATGRYHLPNTTSYSKIVADCCYATAEEAEADGFSESRW